MMTAKEAREGTTAIQQHIERKVGKAVRNGKTEVDVAVENSNVEAVFAWLVDLGYSVYLYDNLINTIVHIDWSE